MTTPMEPNGTPPQEPQSEQTTQFTTQTMPAMPPAPQQFFTQPVDDVYHALTTVLAHNKSFTVNMADDVSKSVHCVATTDGANMSINVMPAQQGGTIVQIVSANPMRAQTSMDASIIFGDIARQLMTGSTNSTHAVHGVAPNWVLPLSIAAAVVSVVALVLLIVLTPKTGAWLVWVLGGLSIILSGIAVYAAFARNTTQISRIISAGAAVVSVVALILGFVNLPKATTTSAEKPSSSHSSSSTQSHSSSSDSEAKPDTTTPSSKPSQSTESTDGETKDDDATVEGLTAIITAIENDMNSSLSAVQTKLTEAESKLGDTYESYKANASALTDWYEFVQAESNRLYTKIGDNTIKYWQTLSKMAQADKYLDAYDLSEEYYDAVYDNTLDDWYDEIYDGLLDDMYDKYYDGVLDDAYDTVPYDEWSDARGDAYDAWSDARSDFYSDWSDMRSAVYDMYSDVRSDIYDDDYDFSKAITRAEKKFSKFDQSE